MKKIILLLISAMILMSVFVSGCKKQYRSGIEVQSDMDIAVTKTDSELIIGTWEGSYDYGKYIAAEMKKDENVGKYIPENVIFSLKLIYTFGADGILETGMEDNSDDKIDNFLIDLYTQVFTDYFNDMAEQYSMTTQELLDLLTADFVEDIRIETIEDYVKYSFSNSDYKDTLPDIMNENKCKYIIEDGKIYTSETVDKEINKNEFITYTLTENELVLTGDSTGNVNDNYPLTFIKVG